MELAFFDNLSIKGWKIQTREHNAANELIEIDGSPLLYDADGNLTDDGLQSYEWDALNRLKEVRDSEGELLASYTCDAGNRVVTKTNPEQTIRYIYDGWQVISEVVTGETEKEYIYSGQYIDDRIMMISNDGEFYYQTNSQFSVASMTDSIGEVVCRYFYSPYGEHGIEGENHGNPYTYTGRRYEAETALHNFRFRWYSAAQGRFISRDPIGYVDGMNLYGAYFVPNDLDAFGLDNSSGSWVNWINPIPIIGTIVNLFTNPPGTAVSDYTINLSAEDCECKPVEAELACLQDVQLQFGTYSLAAFGSMLAHDLIDMVAAYATAPTVVGAVIFGGDLVADTALTLEDLADMIDAVEKAKEACVCP